MIPPAKQLTMPYRAILVVRNPRGVECRLPIMVHSYSPMLAALAAMEKGKANGHDVVRCDSVSLA